MPRTRRPPAAAPGLLPARASARPQSRGSRRSKRLFRGDRERRARGSTCTTTAPVRCRRPGRRAAIGWLPCRGREDRIASPARRRRTTAIADWQPTTPSSSRCVRAKQPYPIVEIGDESPSAGAGDLWRRARRPRQQRPGRGPANVPPPAATAHTGPGGTARMNRRQTPSRPLRATAVAVARSRRSRSRPHSFRPVCGTP